MVHPCSSVSCERPVFVFLEGTTGLLLITYFFRKMADEKTARGKPLPKEEVEFVLIGAGEIVAIVHNSRVYPDP